MSFDPKALQMLPGSGAYGSGSGLSKVFREARYITADAVATVLGANYFDAAASRLPKNTVVVALCVANGTPVVKTLVVTANTGTAVTVADQDVVGT